MFKSIASFPENICAYPKSHPRRFGDPSFQATQSSEVCNTLWRTHPPSVLKFFCMRWVEPHYFPTRSTSHVLLFQKYHHWLLPHLSHSLPVHHTLSFISTLLYFQVILLKSLFSRIRLISSRTSSLHNTLLIKLSIFGSVLNLSQWKSFMPFAA